MIKVGIVGGTGYTGVELLRLLAQHPEASLEVITSRTESGMPVSDMFPSLRTRVPLAFSEPNEDSLRQCDVVFFATPHGVAMKQARNLLDAGVKVIDLAADFRIKDQDIFKQWYGMAHSEPELLAEAVYGLPEINREAISRGPPSGLAWLLSDCHAAWLRAAFEACTGTGRRESPDCRLQVGRVRSRQEGRVALPAD